MDDIVMSTPSITSSLKPITKVAKQGLVDINSLTKNMTEKIYSDLILFIQTK